MTYLKKEIKYLKQILTREEIKYFNFHKKRYLDILQSIHINKNVKILDLGCSNGHLLLILKKLGADVCGVDYTDKCKERFKKYGIMFKKCNIESDPLPYLDDTFDYVMMNEVIEHLVKEINLPIKECKRILKKNGKLIISTPNACELGKRLLFLLGKNIYWDINSFYERGIYERHNREFSMDELKFILKINGFSKFKSKYLSSWEGLRQIEKNNPLATIISMIQKIFPKFRSNLLIIANKSN